jgi:acyl-CoA dehydrogenase
MDLTKDWFVEARLQIAANCLGAAIRAFEVAEDWAGKRHQFGGPIRQFQAVEFMLAEMAGRVVDRAVPILGGRGYMRENPVERLYRDVRVDRIWEGTSGIQRVIIGGQIARRGTGGFKSWPGQSR